MLQKQEKVCLDENIKDVAQQPCGEEMVWMWAMDWKQSHQQENFQFEPKETEMG